MYKNTFGFLLLLTTGVVVLLMELYNRADVLNKKKNGFVRRIRNSHLTVTGVLAQDNQPYYLAGSFHDSLYLGSYKQSGLVKTDARLSYAKFFSPASCNIPEFSNAIPFTAVDFPFYLSWSEKGQCIAVADMQTNRLYHKTNRILFSAVAPLSDSDFVIRHYDTAWHQNDLIQVSGLDSLKRNSAPVLEKQMDGLFCTDGMLRWDRAPHGLMVYIYYYRNQFICLDTAFHIIYKAHTIDTVSQVKIAVSDLVNGTALTSPPANINKGAFVEGGRVFIYSTLRADNESGDDFRNNGVIDVYHLQTGKYLFTFYVPPYKTQKLNRFGISGQTLVAFYPDYVVTYKLGLASF